MKKLISIIAALSMIASLGVTSFAAIDASISVTDAAKATLVKQDDGSFTADLAANSNASQDTIVVIKGTNPDDITTTSIEYINQDVASQNFNFVLKNTPDAEEDFTEGNTLTYTVLMGGDKVEKTTVGTITYTYTADEYTVTYVIDGETYDSTKTVKGIPQLPATTPTKDADEENTYAFEGWYTDTELTTAFDATVAISADTTVYGKFTATPIPGGDEGGEDTDEYTLTFLNADGTTFATIDTVDGAVVLPETDPTKANSGNKQYGFVGWYTDDAFTTKIADATITASQNIYPKFVQIGVYGDANADGSANATDLVFIKQKVVKGDSYTGTVGTAYENCKTSTGKSGVKGDANGDGNANATDLVFIKQKVVKGDSYTGTVGTLMTVVKD